MPIFPIILLLAMASGADPLLSAKVYGFTGPAYVVLVPSTHQHKSNWIPSSRSSYRNQTKILSARYLFMELLKTDHAGIHMKLRAVSTFFEIRTC